MRRTPLPHVIRLGIRRSQSPLLPRPRWVQAQEEVMGETTTLFCSTLFREGLLDGCALEHLNSFKQILYELIDAWDVCLLCFFHD